MTHLSSYQQLYLNYTDEIKKIETKDLILEIQIQSNEALEALDNMQDYGEIFLREYKNEFERATQYIFICIAEIMRRQTP
jgi:hypothetical protein